MGSRRGRLWLARRLSLSRECRGPILKNWEGSGGKGGRCSRVVFFPFGKLWQFPSKIVLVVNNSPMSEFLSDLQSICVDPVTPHNSLNNILAKVDKILR